MATLKYNSNFNLSKYIDLDKYDEDSARLSEHQLSASNGSTKIVINGSFDYWVYDPYYDDNHGIDGIITSLKFEQSGKSVLSITDMHQDFMNFDHAESSAVALLMNGNDKVEGSAQGDNLNGYDGQDWLYGNKGEDNLKGGNGGDHLIGGSGADILTGGAGADVFIFNKTTESRGSGNRDNITDFGGKDVIDLNKLDANSIRSGNQDFRFIGDDAFSGKAGELREKNGIVQADTDGDGHANFGIEVDFASISHSSLNAGDFLL